MAMWGTSGHSESKVMKGKAMQGQISAQHGAAKAEQGDAVLSKGKAREK